MFYYGTGEPIGNSAVLFGIGLFKSDDNAQSFKHLSHTNNMGGIWDVEHSISKDSTIYVATHTNGLWRSTDAGNSFTKIYSSSKSIHEIKVFEDSTIMIAINELGIVEIDENTLQSTQLSNNFPTSDIGRISFDYCKDFPNVIYAHITNSSGTQLNYAVKSSDKGKSWINLTNNTGAKYDIAWYAFKLSVCPTDSNFVISSSVSPRYTDDGGGTWKIMRNSHADYHDIQWYNGNQFLVSNDGGIYRMSKSNMSTATNLNNGYNVTQFYAGNYASVGDILIGGTQDNGTYLNSTPSQFLKVHGGDGASCAIDQQSGAYIYQSSQNLDIYRTTSSSKVKISNFILANLGTINNTWFINPFEINPADSRQIYVPTRREVYRTLNAGNTWIKLTKVLAGDPYSIGVGSGEDPTIYIGGTNSRLYRVDNAATTEAEQEVFIFNPNNDGFNNSTIGCIEVDPNNDGTIYCALTTISANSRIWKITDADKEEPKWYDISSNLPSNMAVNWVELDPDNPGHLYIGTDYGLYSTLNDGGKLAKGSKITKCSNRPIEVEK